VVVSVDQSGQGEGTYTATITVSAVGVSGVAPVSVPVTLSVVKQIRPAYLPLAFR
jgi:hypothetical protein